MERSDLFLYGIIFIIVLAIMGFAYFTLAPQGHTETKYLSATSAENPVDICKAPEGYSDADWQQHMSHHPDRYSECLKTSK